MRIAADFVQTSGFRLHLRYGRRHRHRQKQAQGKQLRNIWSGLCLGASSDKPFALVRVPCKQTNQSTWAIGSSPGAQQWELLDGRGLCATAPVV